MKYLSAKPGGSDGGLAPTMIRELKKFIKNYPDASIYKAPQNVKYYDKVDATFKTKYLQPKDDKKMGDRLRKLIACAEMKLMKNPTFTSMGNFLKPHPDTRRILFRRVGHHIVDLL